MNEYFVSYQWKTFFRSGCGMCVLTTDESMETKNGLLAVREAIVKHNRFRGLVILSYKKLGESDV